MKEPNNTVKQVLELLDRKKRVLRHGKYAYYTYVDGKQFPSNIVKQATQIHYERRVQQKKDIAEWGKAWEKFKAECAPQATGDTLTPSNS